MTREIHFPSFTVELGPDPDNPDSVAAWDGRGGWVHLVCEDTITHLMGVWIAPQDMGLLMRCLAERADA